MKDQGHNNCDQGDAAAKEGHHPQKGLGWRNFGRFSRNTLGLHSLPIGNHTLRLESFIVQPASVALATHSERVLQGLGWALQDARDERGLTQEALSLETGVHRNYIGGIERANAARALR
jgi:hypothetical protein